MLTGGITGGNAGPSGAPVNTGPVSVNVAGFGARASGSASMNTDDFPAAFTDAAAAVPAWILPAIVIAVAVILIRRS
jgi:hypothetical protein